MIGWGLLAEFRVGTRDLYNDQSNYSSQANKYKLTTDDSKTDLCLDTNVANGYYSYQGFNLLSSCARSRVENSNYAGPRVSAGELEDLLEAGGEGFKGGVKGGALLEDLRAIPSVVRAFLIQVFKIHPTKECFAGVKVQKPVKSDVFQCKVHNKVKQKRSVSGFETYLL